MLISDDTKGVVDPRSLVFPRFRGGMGSVVPGVVRPILLTDQLRGCGPCGCGGGCSGLAGVYTINPGMEGLGQIDPASLSLEINTMIASAREFWNSLVKALGIGAGRREADVIVPMQDKITQTVLVPASTMRTNAQNYSCTDLRKMLGVITQAGIEFKAFLTNTKWQDGRAAQQALVWLEGPLPATSSGAWFHQALVDFQGTTTQRCGAVGGGTPIPPGGNVTGTGALLPVLLGAAFFLMKR